MIVSVEWRTPATILLILQANELVVLLSNQRKEHQRPKASYSSVLVEGNLTTGSAICQAIYFALDA